jgi:hypothetical protein
MQQQMIGTTQQVRFDLIDLKSFAAASKPGP